MLRFNLIIVFLLSVFWAKAQNETDSIKYSYKNLINQLPQLTIKKIVKQNENGSVDTIKFYSRGEQIIYIYQYTYQDALSYGEGVPLSDIHTLKEYFLIKGKVRFFRLKNINDKYVNYKKGTQFSAEEQEVYFNHKGKCMLFRTSELEEIDNKSFMEIMSRALTMKDVNCLYSPYGQKEILTILEMKEQ